LASLSLLILTECQTEKKKKRMGKETAASPGKEKNKRNPKKGKEKEACCSRKSSETQEPRQEKGRREKGPGNPHRKGIPRGKKRKGKDALHPPREKEKEGEKRNQVAQSLEEYSEGTEEEKRDPTCLERGGGKEGDDRSIE